MINNYFHVFNLINDCFIIKIELDFFNLYYMQNKLLLNFNEFILGNIIVKDNYL